MTMRAFRASSEGDRNMILRLALVAWLALCGVANAQLSGGLQFPGPGTAHSSGGGGTLTFAIDATDFAGIYNTSTMALVCPSASCTVSGSSSTQYGIGTASANRNVIVALGYGGAAAAANAAIGDVKINGTTSGSSCTGGIQATKAMDSAFGAGSNGASSIWYAPVPTGTTVTVCFTTVGGNGWGGQGVVTVATIVDTLGAASMSVSGSAQTASPPNYPGNCTAGTCSNSWSSTTVPTGGLGIAVGITNDSGFPSSSWSGTASPTKAKEANNAAATTSPIVWWSTSGTVTQAITTGGQGGWGGVIFAP